MTKTIKTFLLLGLLITHAQAETTPFVCRESRQQNFTAQLDYSKYQEGSGFADMLNATILNNFLTTNLICSSQNTAGNYGCTGFQYGTGNENDIIFVEIKTNSAKPTLTIKTPHNQINWNCH